MSILCYASEIVSSAPFTCHCNHERCIGMVCEFKYLDNKKVAQLLATIPLFPYLNEIDKNRQ